MSTAALVAIVFAIVGAGVLAAHAAPPYDGSVPMNCAIETVMWCNVPESCVRGTAQTVQLPPVLTVDVGNRVIGGSRIGRTVRIHSTAHSGGKLMIAGQDVETLSRMWGLVVDEKTGLMSGALLSHGGGLLIFGTCTVP